MLLIRMGMFWFWNISDAVHLEVGDEGWLSNFSELPLTHRAETSGKGQGVLSP
jgi:hypothetical protein